MKKSRRPHTRRRRQRKKELFVFRDDHRYHISFRTFFTVILIFLGGLGSAFTYAYLGALQTQIAGVRAALQVQRETNAALRADITQKYTLDEVARIAIAELGMNKPDHSQIVYINVPLQSSVELYDDTASSEPKSRWQEIKTFFAALIEIE